MSQMLDESDRQQFLDQMQTLFEDGQSYVQVMKEMQNQIEEPKSKKAKTESSFIGNLMDFQVEGLQFLYSSWLCGMNGILADDMGLGKTVQCLAFFAKLHDAESLGRIIVICPSAVVYNWVSEMDRFTPDLPCIMHVGLKEERRLIFNSLPKNCVIVTSYQVYMNDAMLFNKHRFHVCVIDEAHRLKNNKCKLSNLMEGLIVDDRILLTGTPLQNDILELWSLLKFCLPNIFDKSFFVFEEWMSMIKAKNEETSLDLIFKMKKIIEPHMLRRTKKKVFPDMLHKKSFIVYCPLNKHQQVLYNAAEKSGEELRSAISSYCAPFTNTVKTAFNRLKLSSHPMREIKICCHPFLYAPLDLKRPFSSFEASGKFCVLFQLLAHLLKEKDNKIIIFTQFVDIIDLIAEELEKMDIKHCLLHGSTKLEDRQSEIELFQKNPEFLVFIATTRSGGLGLNLTAANNVILYDIDWNPQVLKINVDG
eukprot:NODE_907_length_3188_cov_0.123988.p1 type:complete len:477 gc:universal NODE_907_length_3188_cov_0.123988:637-2067(+)